MNKEFKHDYKIHFLVIPANKEIQHEYKIHFLVIPAGGA
jgi:hypothetical protein